jgi:hypothetical protein
VQASSALRAAFLATHLDKLKPFIAPQVGLHAAIRLCQHYC